MSFSSTMTIDDMVRLFDEADSDARIRLAVVQDGKVAEYDLSPDKFCLRYDRFGPILYLVAEGFRRYLPHLVTEALGCSQTELEDDAAALYASTIEYEEL